MPAGIGRRRRPHGRNGASPSNKEIVSMSYKLNLDAIDADGAIRETALEAEDAIRSEGVDEGDTRLSFLKKTGMAGGALAGGATILGALSPAAMAGGFKGRGRPPRSFGKGDIGILNYALTLEYLERAFYNEATANNVAKDPRTVQFLSVVTEDERAHVAALRNVLGPKAAKLPKFNFRNTTKDEALFQQTAFVLENTGVHAYAGQAGNIHSPKVVRTAVSIITIEARHASVIGQIIKGRDGITPNGAFDTAYTAKRVLAAVKGTKFIVS